MPTFLTELVGFIFIVRVTNKPWNVVKKKLVFTKNCKKTSHYKWQIPSLSSPW
jgi:hypothetical protein